MKDLIFTSVAFGSQYCEQQLRLKRSILEIYPEANLNFYYNRVPISSRSMEDSLYGFKVHAVKESYDFGYKRVLWLDPAMILCRKIDLFSKYKMIAIKDDNKLRELISQKCLDYFKTTRDDLEKEKIHLVGGSLYYFDFNYFIIQSLFKTWYLAESKGYFGSQHEAASEQINGHRNDESVMAMAMRMHQVNPVTGPEVGYCNQNNPIFIKKHFK